MSSLNTLQVVLCEDGTLLDEEGNDIGKATIDEMAFGGLGNKRLQKTGSRYWKFAVGNLKSPDSIPADHGFRHFVALGKSDPAFAKDVSDAGISMTSKSKSAGDKEESGEGSFRVEPSKEDPSKMVKVRDMLHVRTLGKEQHAPFARALDKWAGHIEAHGGSKAHADRLRFEASSARVHFGTGTPEDEALVGAGRPGARASGPIDFGAFDLGGGKKAADAGTEFDAGKEGKKKGKGKKADAAEFTQESVRDPQPAAKAAWKLVESRKAAKPAAKVDEAKA